MSEQQTEQKQKKKRGSKNRRVMKEYPIPEGGFQTSETPGFDVKAHKKLPMSAFSDPLCYYDWEHQFFQAQMKLNREKRAQFLQLGGTPEERSLSMRILELQRRLDRMKDDKTEK